MPGAGQVQALGAPLQHRRLLRSRPRPPHRPPLSCTPPAPARSVLGTGHYGVTYLCSSLKSGELVAIKALDKLHPEYERDLACEEILILAAVSDHPNVVDMHEVRSGGTGKATEASGSRRAWRNVPAAV